MSTECRFTGLRTKSYAPVSLDNLAVLTAYMGLDPEEWVSAAVLYSAYVELCEASGMDALSKNRFGRSLTYWGCASRRSRLDGKQARYWRMTSQAFPEEES